MARVCIICEKEPAGKAYAVRDDAVIKAIRAVKRKLGVARNNELYVDEACLPAYREKRKKFEKNMVFYIAIGAVIFILVNGFQIAYGRFSLITFLASAVLALMIAAMAVLNYATPPLESMEAAMKEPAAAPAPAAPAQKAAAAKEVPAPKPAPAKPAAEYKSRSKRK